MQALLHSTSHNITDAFIGSIMTLITNVLIVTPMLRLFRCQRKWANIHTIFLAIENRLSKNMHQTFSSSTFLLNYCVQVTIIMLTFVMSIVIKFVVQHHNIAWKTDLAYAFYRMHKYIVTFHVLFYINMLSSMLAGINAFLFKRADVDDDDNDDCDSHIIKLVIHHRDMMKYLWQCRNVHYGLYMATSCVNELFGWTFVFLIIHNLIDSVYNSYWIFCYMELRENIFLIRMYKIE